MTIRPFLRRCLPLAAVAPLALTAASCGPGVNQFAPVCPVPGLVKPLAEMARYRGASRDVRDLEIRARIVDIAGTCKPGRDGIVLATVRIVAEVSRGPALSGSQYTLPMFVAVTDSGDVRDKSLYSVPVEFERGQERVRAASAEIELELPVSATKTAAAYGIVAGFQLTPDEVAAYRRDRR